MALPGIADDATAHVAILLSTHDGERFLAEQLRSFEDQTHARWALYWRDDGSRDATGRLLEAFADRDGRCASARCAVSTAAPLGAKPIPAPLGAKPIPAPLGAKSISAPLGAMASFLTLLRTARSAAEENTVFAFADQDDVWLPDKLARGVRALAATDAAMPALYCAGQIVVDAELRPIGRSPPLSRRPGFPAALTQNVATGCTVMLNGAAADLVLASDPPPRTLHDWWCYLVVTAAGGAMIADPAATVLYRQHAGNLVGAPRGPVARGIAALQRGPLPFMLTLRQHVAALEAQPHLLTPAAAADLALIAAGLRGGLAARLAALRLPGFRRQTWQEDLIFWLWFSLG